MIPAVRAIAAVLALSCTPLFGADIRARIATPAGTPVEDAAIVLEPADRKPPRSRGRTKISQQDREFIPHVSVIQSGTTVEFPNLDSLKHHVYSFSPAKVFEIKLYEGRAAQPVIFDKPGEVAVGCNIHDWMEAYLFVVESPYFGKSDGKGRIVIPGVPAGTYLLRLWHPRQRVTLPARRVEVGSSPVRLDLALDVLPRILKPKPPVGEQGY